MELVKRLWAGDLPLKKVFWDYAIFYGLLVNVTTDVAFYALLMNDGNMALVALAFAIPIPYNILIVVAVWRSAGRYPGPKKWSELARIGIIIWMTGLTLV